MARATATDGDSGKHHIPVIDRMMEVLSAIEHEPRARRVGEHTDVARAKDDLLGDGPDFGEIRLDAVGRARAEEKIAVD